MANYILRNLPDEIWTPVKARAAREGWPLRALLLALLRGYADGTVTLQATAVTVKPAP